MQFNDSSTSQGLLQHINFLCGLSQSDTTRYSTADKVRNVNAAYRTVLGWIWKSQGDWTFDDSNLTTLPYFKTNCANGQDDYTLPTNYGVVERIEYKDVNGNWLKLKQVTKSEMQDQAVEEFRKTDGTPNMVELFANSYRLYPSANRTSTDGDSIRVYCTRDIDAFAAADTTQEPGFNANYHHILAVMAAKDWAVRTKDSELITSLELQEAKLKADIEQYYGNRGNLRQEAIKPRNRQRFAR